MSKSSANSPDAPAAKRPYTAALIAGGRSTRMGEDKAGVLVGGERLWQRQLTLLQSLAPAELLISGKLDGAYASAGAAIVPDDDPGQGPLGGIATLLRRAQHPLLLVLAIDLPLITPAFLSELLHEAQSTRCGIVPEHAGRFEPLAAVYLRESDAIAADVLRSGDHSLQQFVRRCVAAGMVKPRPLLEDEFQHFRNVNTREELQLLNEQLRGKTE